MKLLEEGILKRRKGLAIEGIKYTIALLDDSYIDEALKLQEIVIGSLPSEEIYKSDTKEFIEECLEQEGVLLGVFENHRLIAYRFLNFPGNDERNFGRDLNLSNDELMKVAHFESVLVHPDYIGNGLQRKTFEIAEDIVKKYGYYHIFSLISPKNYYSVKNVLGMDLNIKGLKKKYSSGYGGEGKFRYILHKDLRGNEFKKFKESILVNSMDIEEQKKLISSGYVGYKVEGSEAKFNISYGR